MPLHFDLRSEIGSLSEADRLDLSAEDIVGLLTRFEKLGTWRIDARTGECRISAVCREIYGFSRDDGSLTVAAYRDRIHPDDLPVFAEAIKTTIEQKSSFMVTYRVKGGSTYRFVRSIGMYREDQQAGGEVVGISFVVGEHIRQLVMTS